MSLPARGGVANAWDPARIAAAVRLRAADNRGHLGELISIAVAESAVYRLIPPSTAGGVKWAMAAGVIGIAAYWVGRLSERAYRIWHVEQIAVRDDVIAQLAAQLPQSPRIEVDCHGGSRAVATPGDQMFVLWILTNVRLVNLSDAPVSLTFHLDTDVRYHTGDYGRARGPQDNGRKFIVDLVPAPQLIGPVDIEPKTSVFGNIGFFLGAADVASRPTDRREMILHVSDAVAQMTGYVKASGRHICVLNGAQLPDVE